MTVEIKEREPVPAIVESVSLRCDVFSHVPGFRRLDLTATLSDSPRHVTLDIDDYGKDTFPISDVKKFIAGLNRLIEQ